MTRVEVIEHCHKVNLLKIKQSEFEMMYGHFFFIQISKISFVTPLSKKKSFLLKLFPNKGYHHTRSQLEMHMKSTQRLNEENSLKVNHNKKIITKWLQMKEVEIKSEKSKVFKKSWEIADAIPRWQLLFKKKTCKKNYLGLYILSFKTF